MLKRNILILISALVLISGSVLAADDLGAKIYPGAKKDERRSKLANDSSKANGLRAVVYHTKDAPSKVADFYQMAGYNKLTLQPLDASFYGAFVKGNITVTITFIKLSETYIAITNR